MSGCERIKERLYTEEPNAFFESIRDGHLFYNTTIGQDKIVFKIPLDEGNDLRAVVKAQLLIRWLYKNS